MTHRVLVRAASAAGLVAAFLAAGASPAGAHGIGGRTDLPLPLWLFSYGAGAVVIASFVALRFLWPRPRLRAAAEGRAVPAVLDRLRVPGLVVGRTVGLASLVLVLAAAWAGSGDSANNLAPVAVYVVFWVGLQVASAVLGDVWRIFDPLDTLAAGAQALRGRSRRLGAEVGAVAGPTRTADADGDTIPAQTAGRATDQRPTGPRALRNPGQWTAAALLFTFVWLELAYYDSADPRAVALWLSLYVIVALAGAAMWGRGWLRYGEGFAALFRMLATLSPLFVEGGRLRFRVPCSGLTTYRTRPGTGALILVVLGSTTFDGLARTELWAEIAAGRTGWARTLVATAGLVVAIAAMATVYLAATRVMGRITRRDPVEMAVTFLGSLIPILLAYSMAHYFSLLVFEGQSAWALLSDPFGRGWDLFGTAAGTIDYSAVSVDTIAYTQAGAIVVGHVIGVIAAHDRAVELFPRKLAEASQYPLLGVMVLYTIGGLALLLGG